MDLKSYMGSYFKQYLFEQAKTWKNSIQKYLYHYRERKKQSPSKKLFYHLKDLQHLIPEAAPEAAP